jgi:RNA polymerase sigma factor (sigma-70 family)
MLATIRRLVEDPDDVDDVFAVVSQALSENDLERLRRFVDDPKRGRFSTWLVAVVRNLTIDWLRRRDGRRQASAAPAVLSELQREIYIAIFVEGRTHIEAFEMMVARRGESLSFRSFLQALRETYRLAPPKSRADWDEQIAPAASERAERADTARHLADALAAFPPEHRLALELFVIEGMAAAQVAQVVGWPNAKAVYNNIYRMIDALRAKLARAGITSRDLG